MGGFQKWGIPKMDCLQRRTPISPCFPWVSSSPSYKCSRNLLQNMWHSKLTHLKHLSTISFTLPKLKSLSLGHQVPTPAPSRENFPSATTTTTSPVITHHRSQGDPLSNLTVPEAAAHQPEPWPRANCLMGCSVQMPVHRLD